jgi:hypothetical protein
MATTTRAVLRQRLSEAIGDYLSLTATANGATDGTTVVDSGLRNLAGGRDDDAFEGWYVLITSGDASGEIKRVLQSRQANNTLTLQTAFSAQIASTATYELHRQDPTLKHNAINRGIEELSNQVPLPLRDETIVVDNTLTNWDFETFVTATTTFTGWSSTGTPTLAQNTSLTMHGDGAASVAATGATEGLYQTVTINANEVTNKQVTFECWVYATVADAVRIRILWGSASYESHAYHSGSDQWELQSIQATVPTSATEITAVLEVTSGNTGIFDAAWVSVQHLYKYTIPTSMISGPNFVSQQLDRFDPSGTYVPVIRGTGPETGRILRLEGKGMLSRPSSDTATIEAGEPYVNIITAYAAMFYNRIQLAQASQQQRARYSEDMVMWGQEAVSLINELRRPRMGAQRSDHTWHMEEDSSGRYIIFDINRTA